MDILHDLDLGHELLNELWVGVLQLLHSDLFALPLALQNDLKKKTSVSILYSI